jgi:lipoate-protein ligase A
VQHHKICGSAQRRQRGSGLIHGSLLLSRSPHAPELPGLTDILMRKINPADLRSAWTEHLARTQDWQLRPDTLSGQEPQRVDVFLQQFRSPLWNQRR